MKRFLFFVFVFLLFMLVAVLCACGGNAPADTTAPATSTVTTDALTSAPTVTTVDTVTTVTTAVTAPATTEVLTTTVTTAAMTTAPAPNPITAVKEMDADYISHPEELRLTYQNGTRQFIEKKLDIRTGFNSVSYTHNFDESTGILTLTLTESSLLNIANRHLGTAAPTVLRLRENAGWLEWAPATEDTWMQFCRTDNSNVKILAALTASAALGKHPDAIEGDGVTFVISGNNLRFRAHDWLRNGYDIVTDCVLQKETVNGTFMQTALREIASTEPLSSMKTGTLFKSAGDEIPAFYMNGTYIGAGHGTYCISEVPNVGLNALTEADIGKVFTGEQDQRYVLVKVPAGKAWFCPFDDAAMESGDFASYGYPKKGLLKKDTVLTYDTDKTFKVSDNATQTQFRYAVNGCVQHAYLNGTIEVDLTKDGVYTADFVDFHETYNVLYLPAVLTHLMENAGKTDDDGNPLNSNTSHYDEAIDEYYLTYDITHRFHRNGSYTVYQTLTAKKDLNGARSFGVMSEAFDTKNDTDGKHQYIYAPGSTNLGTPTLHTKNENKVMYAEGDYTIRSYYQLTTPDGEKGMNVGYYPYFGVATDEAREGALTDFDGPTGEWYNTLKMYPYLYKNDVMTEGTSISFIAYHVPTIKIDNDFFAINWYFVGDEIYLSFHTDHAVGEKTVALPNAEYLTGLTITVEDISEGFTVHSDTVGADGIRVSTNGAGYCTIKLTTVN